GDSVPQAVVNNPVIFEADTVFANLSFTLNGNGLLTANRTFVVNNSDILMNGVLDDGPGQFGFTKLGPGRLMLAGANTYQGPTLIQQGTLIALASQALGSPSAGTVVSAGSTLAL